MDAVQLALSPETPKGPARVGPAAITYADAKSLLTPASGSLMGYKFSLNPYRGCAFACEYCYARAFAPTDEKRDAWGEWVQVKQNAVSLIRRAARSRSERLSLRPGDAIYMASATDPYQPIEARIGLTRDILGALIPIQPRLTIQTRSPIAARDIDLFRQFEEIRVNFTVTTDSEDVRLRYEPHCPSIDVRLEAARRVKEAGVPIGISITPALPIRDPEAFARRIAALRADRYNIRELIDKTAPRYRTGSPSRALELAPEDNWRRLQFQHAHTVIAGVLEKAGVRIEGGC